MRTLTTSASSPARLSPASHDKADTLNHNKHDEINHHRLPATPPEHGQSPDRQPSSPSLADQKPLSTLASSNTRFPTSASSKQHPPSHASSNQSSDTTDRIKRTTSRHSKSSKNEARSEEGELDVDMDNRSDAEGTVGDDNAASDDDSGNEGDDSKSGKKKRSQRFYCTDYPPCNLSFTRSEHLARHIRKHTGERPFQCHCSRRFSRLDNLRQHAQTVHVNEDIPIDSLAASGSRFQRQIRTDRVRQAGNRARASTSGSAGGPIRGHSKSLSTSSINSVSSVGSGYSMQPDSRRRPPSLIMANASNDPRGRTSVESYRSAGDSAYSFRPASPGDFSTPTSATFSTGQSSPRWSGVASPASSHVRTQSMYSFGEGRTAARRLSVPSGANPFQSPHAAAAAGRHAYARGHAPTSSDVFPPADGHLMPSPQVGSVAGWSARRDSMSNAADEAWRRRTWHPENREYNPKVNQLTTVAAAGQAEGPHPPPPVVVGPPHGQSNFRLPGIESLINRPTTPPQRITSPMQVDSEPPPPVNRRVLQQQGMSVAHPSPLPTLSPQDDRRTNLNMYDAGLQRGLNRLDIRLNTPPRDSPGAWASEVNQAVQAAPSEYHRSTIRFEDQQGAQSSYFANVRPPTHPGRFLHQQTMSAPSVAATSREAKRHGWYHGPAAPPVRQPPPVQDPRAAHADRIVHPNFNGFSGFPARAPEARPQMHPQAQKQPERSNPAQQPRHGNGGMGGLDALVAAATGESSTAKAY